MNLCSALRGTLKLFHAMEGASNDVLPVRGDMKVLVEVLQQFISHFPPQEKDLHS